MPLLLLVLQLLQRHLQRPWQQRRLRTSENAVPSTDYSGVVGAERQVVPAPLPLDNGLLVDLAPPVALALPAAAQVLAAVASVRIACVVEPQIALQVPGGWEPSDAVVLP